MIALCALIAILTCSSGDAASLAVSVGLLQRHSPGEAFVPAPKTLSSKHDIALWVRAHQGYSGDSIGIREFVYRGTPIYVTWVSPFSGRAADQTWVYRAAEDAKWHLIDTHLYEGFLKNVRLDAKRGALIFTSPASPRGGILSRKLKLAAVGPRRFLPAHETPVTRVAEEDSKQRGQCAMFLVERSRSAPE